MTAPEPLDLPRLVDVKHVAKRTGNLTDAGDVTYTDDEVTTVEDYIESVTAVVLDEGDPSWTASTAPARVRVIVVDAVERRLNNPEQLRQRIMAGDLEMYGGEDGWLTAGELATINRLAGKGTGAGTGVVVTSSQTRLAPERVAMMRTGWDDDDEGLHLVTYVL